MLIFRYARNGTLEIEGLKKIAATCNVAEEGVRGAKDFFEAKVKEVCTTHKAGISQSHYTVLQWNICNMGGSVFISEVF